MTVGALRGVSSTSVYKDYGSENSSFGYDMSAEPADMCAKEVRLQS